MSEGEESFRLRGKKKCLVGFDMSRVGFQYAGEVRQEVSFACRNSAQEHGVAVPAAGPLALLPLRLPILR